MYSCLSGLFILDSPPQLLPFKVICLYFEHQSKKKVMWRWSSTYSLLWHKVEVRG